MAYENSKMIEFFNLNKDGDGAIVRLLHTSTSTIEGAKVHHVTIDGKKKSMKCAGAGCPLCERNDIYASDRVYIHLWDYTDNKEKIWNRTDKIISQFKDIEANWGDLSNCVLKITREGNDFPKYNVSIMPPTNYPAIDKSLNDMKLAYRYYLSRSIDDIKTFLAIGVLPKKATSENVAVAKSEYFEKTNVTQNSTVVSTPTVVASTSALPTNDPFVDDDPFADPFNIIKRV